MAKRMISTSFWSDGYIDSLEKEERLMFLYLLTNNKTNIAGVYELPVRLMAGETGLDISLVEQILAKFSQDGKIIHYKSWIRMVNSVKHQSMTSPKIKQGIINELNSVPPDVAEVLFKEYPYPIDIQSHLIIYNSIKLNNNLKDDKSSQAKLANSEFATKPKKLDNSAAYGNKEVNGLLNLAKKDYGFTGGRFDKFAAQRLIKRYGYMPTREMLIKSQELRRQAYAPQVTSLPQLEEKWLKLADYIGEKGTDGIPTDVLEEIKHYCYVIHAHKTQEEKDALFAKKKARYLNEGGVWK